MKSCFVLFTNFFIAIIVVFGCNLVAQTLPGSYTTSWIGNTVGTESDHIMQDINQFYVAPNGYVAAVTNWDEGGHNVMGFDANGTLKCDPQESGTGSWGRMSGEAITYDGTYVYQAMSQASEGNKDDIHYPSSGKWNTVARYNATGRNNSYAGFTDGKGHALHSIVLNTDGADARGLVAYNSELFVAVGNQIIVYQLPLASQSSKRSWTISDPGQLQVDASGYIWMLQPTNKKLIRYSTTGVLQSQSITLTSYVPTGFGIDNTNNKIYITNDNSDQNVLIYNNILNSPILNGTFGVTGGILAGSAENVGTVGPLRFNKPVGVGVDNIGNIYVACNGGGAVIEKYNSSGTRIWYKYGLEFIDCAELAPSSEIDAYTKEEHFTIDYSKTSVGTEQTYKGFTLNRFKYPQDARIHNELNGGVWYREFNGERFLFLTDMFSGWLAVYRFNSSTDGEIAIPCGFFAKGHMDIEGGTWPANQPSNNAWIWRDANGNGNYDSGEYSTYYSDLGGWGWNVDSDGTVWLVEEGTGLTIHKFACQGLDANGSPIYNFTSMVNTTGPSIFTDMQRIEYDAANDQMYLGGYTTSYPYKGSAWGRFGSEIVRVDNWSKGNRTPNMRIGPLPNDNNGDAAIKDMSIAGDYIFAISCFNGEIYVYNKLSGAKVGLITPKNVGSVGWVDMPASIRAHKRSNGEYVIFNEEDFMIKVLMYRWCPTGNCVNICTNNVDSISVEPSITITGFDADTLTAEVYPDTVCYKDISWTSSNKNVATVNWKGIVSSVGVGNAYIKASHQLQINKIDSCLVTVVNVAAESITINTDTLKVPVFKVSTLTVSFTPNNALNRKVSWLSSNNSIATIDSFGQVTAISKGLVNIIATSNDGSFKDTCIVQVLPIPVAGIYFNTKKYDLWENDSIIINAIVHPDDAYNKTINWLSLNPEIASVNNNGMVKGLTLGLAYIIATTQDGNFSDTCEVTVIDADKMASKDIGDVCVKGSLVVENNVYTLVGGGADIWNEEDAFRYAYLKHTGNGVIIARVISEDNTSDWAKAGVMMRETLDADSKHCNMVLTPGNGSTFQRRTQTGGGSDHTTPGNVNKAPYWVKLVRIGNKFSGYTSATTRNWTLIAEAIIEMQSSIYVGLCLTSHKDCSANTSKFDNLIITNNVDTTLYIPNTPPLVTISSPANNSTALISKVITIRATATDDDSIAKVEFYDNDSLIGTDVTSPYGIGYTPIGKATIVLTAKATDNEGLTGISNTVTITVTGSGTGINNANIKSSFVVYPNPADKEITIKLSSSLNENCTLQVIDLTGRLVYSEKITVQPENNLLKVNTSSFNVGMYIVQLSGESQHFIIEK